MRFKSVEPLKISTTRRRPSVMIVTCADYPLIAKIYDTPPHFDRTLNETEERLRSHIGRWTGNIAYPVDFSWSRKRLIEFQPYVQGAARSWTRSDGAIAIDTLAQLHATGYGHQDPNALNWILTESGPVLIDFEGVSELDRFHPRRNGITMTTAELDLIILAGALDLRISGLDALSEAANRGAYRTIGEVREHYAALTGV